LADTNELGVDQGELPKEQTGRLSLAGWGVGWIVLAAVLWSTSALFARAPVMSQWPSSQRGMVLAFWRALFALAFVVPLVRSVCWRWSMLPMAVCFVLMNGTYLSALVMGPPENAIWLQNLSPLWVALLSGWWLSEPLRGSDRRMLAWCTAGVLLILVMELRDASGWIDGLAAILAILSGMFYAGVILCLRHLRDCDSAWMATINLAATTLCFLPFALAASSPSREAWPYLIAFGMLQLGAPYWCFAQGLKTVPGPLAAMLTLLEPILLPIWVFVAWGRNTDYQPPSWWTLIGGLLIMLGLLHGVLHGLKESRAMKEEAECI
jgi:drug/metabolite transporter (DMT)-like permease